MSIDNFLFFINWFIVIGTFVFALFNLQRVCNGYKVWRIPTSSFIILCIIFGAFGIISADFYGYKLILSRLSIWGMLEEVEPVYWYIAKFFNYDIFLFRMMFMVIIITLIVFIIRIFKFPKTISYCIFLLYLYLPSMAIIRSAAADAIMWSGYLYFIIKRGTGSFLMFLLCCSVGLVLHKSSFMVISLFLITLIPLRKVVLQSLILCWPIALVLLRIIVKMIFNTFFEDSQYTSQPLTNSTIGLIKNVINTLFTFSFGIFILWKARKYCIVSYERIIYRCVFWGFYIWLLFLFCGVSRFVGDRFMAHASIPLFSLIIILFCKSKKTRQNLIYYLALFALILQFGILVVWAYHQPYLLNNTYV